MVKAKRMESREIFMRGLYVWARRGKKKITQRRGGDTRRDRESGTSRGGRDSLRVLGEELAGAGGEGAGAGVHQAEQRESGEKIYALGDVAEGEAHEDLQEGGDDRDGGLGAAHEVARNDHH